MRTHRWGGLRDYTCTTSSFSVASVDTPNLGSRLLCLGFCDYEFRAFQLPVFGIAGWMQLAWPEAARIAGIWRSLSILWTF